MCLHYMPRRIKFLGKFKSQFSRKMKQKHSTCWVSRLSTKTADHLIITLLIVFVFSQRTLVTLLQQFLGFCEVRWIITTISQKTMIVLLLTIVSTKRLCNCSNCSYVSPLVQIFQQFRLHHPPTDEEVQTGLSTMTIESEAS